MSICRVHMHALALEVQAVVSLPVWMLRQNLRVSARVVFSLNLSAPKPPFYYQDFVLIRTGVPIASDLKQEL